MSYTPIILAAGESRRMGTPKALLDFDGKTCLEIVLDTCRRSRAASPIVVLGFREADIRPYVPPGIIVIVNRAYQLGQTSSLKAGLGGLPQESEGILLLPVDCPLVRPATIDALLLATRPIVLPVYEGKRGHPALFQRRVVSELLALADEQPAHDVVRRDAARVAELSVDDPGVVLRLNTPEEYERALAAYRDLGLGSGE